MPVVCLPTAVGVGPAALGHAHGEFGATSTTSREHGVGDLTTGIGDGEVEAGSGSVDHGVLCVVDLASIQGGGSECHQLIQIPLWHGGNVATTILCQPAVDVLAGGHAPFLLGADPSLARHQSGNGRLVGEQHAGAVCQFNFGAGDGNLLEAHDGV